jgi:hypothetical protein
MHLSPTSTNNRKVLLDIASANLGQSKFAVLEDSFIQ